MKISQTYKIIISALFVSTLFVGCSSKSATKYSDKNPIYAQLAKYTKIVKISENDKVLSFANITYLNGSKNAVKDDGYHYILVGSYDLVNDLQDQHFIHLIVNDEVHKPIKKEPITLEHPVYENIPMKNSWASYHILKFEDFEDELNLRLHITDKEGNCKAISFEKE